ncbi:hypothetical protein M9H77_29715 [Catharanthus roseus]|uniref:Uncharacterized protein n=1 Tax=Catharanthus roseus TaxID=4058 RepID=A0ACB9ZV85_CATRO|nr:hypothetical protein M9H77_29715 [Catharanthus roseus]
MWIIAPGLLSGTKFVERLYVSESIRGLNCTWLVPPVLGPLSMTWTKLHHALRWDGRLVKSHEWLKTEVGLRVDLIGEYDGYGTEHSYGVWLVLTTGSQNLVPMTLLWVLNSIRGARLLHGMNF